VVAVVVWFVAAPLRSRPDPPQELSRRGTRADLEAAKEAKFREIRDAELDFRTGKLSEDDWRRLDGELRADAVELLRQIDAEGVDEPSPK
jgi:hypothetical protein